MSLSATFLCLATAIWGGTPRLPYLAVMDLRAPGIEAGAAEAITSHLASELVRSGSFRVMERTQMGKILAEQGFQKSGACEKSECEVELGKLLSVDRIIVGDLGRVGSQYALSARMIHVQTGEILISVTETGATSLEEAGSDLVPLIADRLAHSGELQKKWSLTLLARGGSTTPFLGSDLATSSAWKTNASSSTGYAGSIRLSKWWSRYVWTSLEGGVEAIQFSSGGTWDSAADALRESVRWRSETNLQSFQASFLTGFTASSGFTMALGGTWNLPFAGSIEQNIQRKVRMPNGEQSDLEVPSRRLDPTSSSAGGKATSSQFAVEPFWDLLVEVGWTFKPGWHAQVRGGLSLTSFYLPVQSTPIDTSLSGPKILDPQEFSSYSSPHRYAEADLGRGIRLLRVQACVGKSFPF